MNLLPPFSISSRLMPALEIAGATISLERSPGRTADNRDRFAYVIDLPDGSEHSGADLKSGCGGCSLQSAFGDLLSFLESAGQDYPDGENADLFPAPVCQWAAENGDEIAMARLDIEEGGTLIEE
jgi:hypothetical protein